jgi:cytochrome c oxidase subunit III
MNGGARRPGARAPAPTVARGHATLIAARGGVAGGAQVPAQASTRRRSQPSGILGMVLFLCAEAMLFAGLISSYFYLDFRARAWPPAGVAHPQTLSPSILTAVLVATSLPMAVAARRASARQLGGTVTMIVLALTVQCGYLAYQLHSFVGELHTVKPHASSYASVYTALLGLHHAHVLLGILLDLGLLFWLAIGGLSHYRATAVRAIALYWHVINVIAIAVLFTEISPSL